MAWVPDIVRRHWREVVQALLVFLPFVTLPTFGLIWLWQQGYLVIWLLTLLVMTASMLAVRALWRPPPPVSNPNNKTPLSRRERGRG